MDAPRATGALVPWVRARAAEMRAENQDMVLPINGSEGDGKSTVGLLINLIADPTFTVDVLHRRISWHGDTHIRLAERAPRYGALQLDEGEGIIAQDWATGTNRNVKKFLYRCRKMNLWQNFIMPEFEAMQGVLSDWRADWRVEVESKGEATIKRRSDEGHWGNYLEFKFPSLEGTELWERYDRLADRAARGEDVHDLPDPDQDADDEQPRSPFVELVHELEDELEPLGRIAQQTAHTDEGTA